MKDTKYIVKLNMQDTQDSVRDYIREIEYTSYNEARSLIMDLKQDSALAFKKHCISYHYDYRSVVDKIFRVTTIVTEFDT